jgi:hypothetical protein
MPKSWVRNIRTWIEQDIVYDGMRGGHGGPRLQHLLAHDGGAALASRGSHGQAGRTLRAQADENCKVRSQGMQNVIIVAERHGLLIVFLNALLSQGGLPLPLVPTLITVAALARQSPYQITQIILAGVSGALIAEVALYWCGLHYGQRFLGLLCRLSFSPDFCVRRTEQVFARVGS